MAVTDAQRLPAAGPVPKYSRYRAVRKQHEKQPSQDACPETPLKPSASRYRRARNNEAAAPTINTAIPNVSSQPSSSTSAVTSPFFRNNSPEQAERAKIIAETQRRLEGSWSDTSDTNPTTSRSNIMGEWWEDNRGVSRNARPLNPFRDPTPSQAAHKQQRYHHHRQQQQQHQHQPQLYQPHIAQPPQKPTINTQGLHQTSPRTIGQSSAESSPATTHTLTSPAPSVSEQPLSPVRDKPKVLHLQAVRSRSCERRDDKGDTMGLFSPTMRSPPSSASPGSEKSKPEKKTSLAGRLKRGLSIKERRGRPEEFPVEIKTTETRVNVPEPSTQQFHKVLITCNESFASLPVSSTMKVRDVIAAAADVLSEPVDVRDSIVLEACTRLGLERPIRMYELARDVVKTWDVDSQNGFVIIPHPSEFSPCKAEERGAKGGLEVLDAPQKRPGDVVFNMYHCNQSGKWNKRYITLRSDGQVLLSKKENFKETANICHMSDFDIYSLNRRQMSQFKAVKKYCYAIKSQQKQTMFLSTDDYVHYFSTNDSQIADDFYNAVQSWRSWYLVTIVGDKRRKNNGAAESPLASPLKSDYGSMPSPKGQAVRRDPTLVRQAGSLKPLIGMEEADLDIDPANDVDRRLAEPGKLVSRAKTVNKGAAGSPKKTAAVYDNVAGAFEGNRSRAATTGTSGLPEDPFSSKGLLGKVYEERQRDMREREAAATYNADYSIGQHGTGLLRSKTDAKAGNSVARPGRSMMTRSRSRYRRSSNSNPAGRAQSRPKSPQRMPAMPSRSESVKASSRHVVGSDTPPPLEHSQHALNGFGATVIPSQPRNDVSISGEVTNPFARSTTHRQPPNTYLTDGSATGGLSRSNTLHTRPSTGHSSRSQASYNRARSNTTRNPTPNNPFFSPPAVSRQNSFEFDGRVPTLPASWRGEIKRPVPGKGPLVDLSVQSQFAQGSLLRAYEAQVKQDGPVIDRTREGKTVLVRTGERF